MVCIPFVHSSLGPFILIVHPSISKKWRDLAFFSVWAWNICEENGCLSLPPKLVIWRVWLSNLPTLQWDCQTRSHYNAHSERWYEDQNLRTKKQEIYNQTGFKFGYLNFEQLPSIIPMDFQSKNEIRPSYKIKIQNPIMWNPAICEFVITPNPWIISHRIRGYSYLYFCDFYGKCR